MVLVQDIGLELCSEPMLETRDQECVEPSFTIPAAHLSFATQESVKRVSTLVFARRPRDQSTDERCDRGLNAGPGQRRFSLFSAAMNGVPGCARPFMRRDLGKVPWFTVDGQPLNYVRADR